jgi:hypothetical protein
MKNSDILSIDRKIPLRLGSLIILRSDVGFLQT